MADGICMQALVGDGTRLGCVHQVKSYRLLYKKTKINVSTIPPNAKYNPFRKTSVLGINIQNADKTKNSNATPKKIFRK